jgi:maltose alpha-D-glucosyltransferase/alpha-amylase
MLLSESNMWPEEVRAYFGDGDEMHMNFHFPLMPRIFMALSRADRTPIEQIMARTPDLPEICQWGTFLRCHDELTLEMVKPEEREFMWDFYAPESRMRLNMGIRRRLAPLLENDMRRIKVANSILLTFIGSPFLYYGDEIGMGDNIWLEDRDGVRTPMQWDDGPNAGFSTADKEAITDPVIEDEIYGYKRVNVKAQEADLDSLLNWTRRVLCIRKQHPAFGRGRLRMLSPENPAILAYVREYADQSILVLNNLAATRQEATLDLSGFAGKSLVDLLTGETLAAVALASFSVVLEAYGYRWLALE